MMRRLSILAAALAAVTLLAGCAGSAPAGPDPLTQVQVAGEVGSPPTVTIADLSGLGDEPVRQVLVPGDGPETTTESLINARVTVYDGGSKQAVVDYQSVGQVFTATDPGIPAYFADIFVGVPDGSRVLAIVPGSVLMAQSGQPVAPGATPSAPAVIVADVNTVRDTSAWGEPQPPTQNLVTVAEGADGSPTVTITPGAQAPSELVLDVVQRGDGATVAEGDTVYLQYRGVLFPSGAEFDSSWSRGEPTSFATDQVVPGFGQALVGQTAGSRVIAVIPPELAYGAQGSGEKIPPDSTLVFVIDVLGVL